MAGGRGFMIHPFHFLPAWPAPARNRKVHLLRYRPRRGQRNLFGNLPGAGTGRKERVSNFSPCPHDRTSGFLRPNSGPEAASFLSAVSTNGSGGRRAGHATTPTPLRLEKKEKYLFGFRRQSPVSKAFRPLAPRDSGRVCRFCPGSDYGGVPHRTAQRVTWSDFRNIIPTQHIRLTCYARGVSRRIR